MRVLRTAVLLAAGALLGVPATVVPAAPAAPAAGPAVAAAPDDDRSLPRAARRTVRPARLRGEAVEGGDEDRPTTLKVGDWVQRPDDHTRTLHYAIEKTDPASTLRVSVVAQATSADMLAGRLALDLAGPDRSSCDSALGLGNLRTPEILGAGVNAGPGLDCDRGAGTYTLAVDVHVRDPLPLGIRVREEPAVDDVGFSDHRAPRVGDTYVTGRAREVAGGTSYAGAPEIGEGRWSSEVLPGEVLLYRLPLDFGQAADVRVTFRPEGIGVAERRLTYVGLVLSDPMHSPLVAAGGGESVETVDDPLTSAVPPVSRARTIAGGVAGTADWTMAGDHHVAVSMGLTDPFDPASASQPFTIHVAVTGEPADGPTYAGGLTWSVADGTSRPAAAPARAPGWPVAAVAAVAAGAGALGALLLTGALVRRRRRRPEPA